MSEAEMNFEKYWKTVQNMPPVIMPSENPKVKINLGGLIAYARSVGKQPAELSDEEKAMFVDGDYQLVKDFYNKHCVTTQ